MNPQLKIRLEFALAVAVAIAVFFLGRSSVNRAPVAAPVSLLVDHSFQKQTELQKTIDEQKAQIDTYKKSLDEQTKRISDLEDHSVTTADTDTITHADGTKEVKVHTETKKDVSKKADTETKKDVVVTDTKTDNTKTTTAEVEKTTEKTQDKYEVVNAAEWKTRIDTGAIWTELSGKPQGEYITVGRHADFWRVDTISAGGLRINNKWGFMFGLSATLP